MGVIEVGRSFIGVNIRLGVAKSFLSDNDISTCLVVMNVVVIGVVVLGIKVWCEVKWEVGEKR